MKLYDGISEDIAEWAQAQPVFFTGSASTHGRHINVSPKGLADSHFAIFGPNQCAYIDRTGSGCETISHSYENGRLCLMFMSFGPAPRILRLFCRSRVVEFDQPQFGDLIRKISRGKRDSFDGARAVILCDVWQVQTSCGYGVPRVKKAIYAPDQDATGDDNTILEQGFEPISGKLDERCVFETRPTLDVSGVKLLVDDKAMKYRGSTNARSMDGLPGMKSSRRYNGEQLWIGDLEAKIRRLHAEKTAMAVGFGLAMALYFVLIVLQMLQPPVGWETKLTYLRQLMHLPSH